MSTRLLGGGCAPRRLRHSCLARWRARGWTVIELMIALALGLLVALLASGLLLASGSNYRDHSENAWLNDAGRYAMEILAQSIRQGGYVQWDSAVAPPGLVAEVEAAVSGLDAHSIAKGADGIGSPLPALAHGSDVLALRFSGSGAVSGGDGSSLNCGGFSEAAPRGEGERGWSIFYVAQDASGEAELRCKYRGDKGWGADAIVRGVESFQVLYGVDTDVPADGVPNTYINASAVAALDGALALAGATPEQRALDLNRKTYWKRVCSIRVAMLLHGDGNTRSDAVASQYDLFGAAYADAHGEDAGVRVLEASLPADQRWRARRLFSMTVALRNRSG